MPQPLYILFVEFIKIKTSNNLKYVFIEIFVRVGHQH